MTEHIVEIVDITSAIIAIMLALVALVFASSACETAARSHFLMNSFSGQMRAITAAPIKTQMNRENHHAPNDCADRFQSVSTFQIQSFIDAQRLN